MTEQKTFGGLPEDELAYYFSVLQALEGADASSSSPCTEELRGVLDAFRMACTNLPIQPARVAAAREALDSVLSARGDLLSRTAVVHATHLQSRAAQTAPRAAYLAKSCYVQQEMQCVLPGIYIGSYHPAANKEILRKSKITHVCCCIGVQPRFPGDFSYVCLAADDRAGYNVAQHFPETFAFIDDAVSRGGSVLVHCGAGISRAPTILAAYLIQKLGVSANDAVQMIRKVRSCASPNVGFMDQLRDFEASRRK